VKRPGLSIAALLGLSLFADASPAAARKPRPPVEAKQPEPAPPPPADAAKDGEAPRALVEATATVWAQAGSRSWTGCGTIANEARKQLFGYGEEVNNFRDNHHWAIQARECPNAPEVLTMAARSELLRRFDLPEGLDADTDLGELELAVAESRTRALAWIDAAQTELRRRRDPRKHGLEYWRGRALLSTGDIEGAIAALDQAARDGATEGWMIRRLLALAELFTGDLEAALTLANRAFIDAPTSDRQVSTYVLALVLDRAGDTAGAERRMKFALDYDGDGSKMRTLESALPLHERLYLRAYAKTVRRDASGALRLWDAYLARPEPEGPERRLAERHRNALEPLPSNLGGPAHPDEGKAASGKAGTDSKAP
jgi:tetratricopeptide (TPR) repeat protein